jgi:aspartyl-tRNA(Asn)/glutamyl-tRNA(Gln) amidotransferase subunit B
MVEDARISLNAAKSAFAAMCRTGKSAEATVTELGLAQVSDEAAIAEACDKVLAAESAKLAEYRAGRDKLYGFFVGAVMKALKRVQQHIEREAKGLPPPDTLDAYATTDHQ